MRPLFRKRAVLCLFSLLLSVMNASVLLAQALNTFPEEETEFLKKLGDFVMLSKQEEVKKVFANFEIKMKSGGFNPTESKRIHSTCNKMLSYKLNAIPYFTDYLHALTFIESNKDAQSSKMEAWQNVIDAMLDDAGAQNRRFEAVRQFLAFSEQFYEKRVFRFAESITNWYAPSPDYILKYEKGVPTLEWKKLNLIARLKKDSIVLWETSGTFYPMKNLWKGSSGKVAWARNNLPDVYCLLSDYSIDVTKGFYKAEKVKIHYPSFFPDRDIDGNFEDKLTYANEKVELSYPRFESYERVLKINNIGGGIQYEGGFRLHGTTVFGFGTKDMKAHLNMIDRKSRRSFRAGAETFVIRKGENIIGERVETAVYFGKDSIYHPSVKLKIDIHKSEVSLERGQRGSDRNPFYNSFQQMTIDVSKINWYIAHDSLVIGDKSPGMGTIKNEAVFESLQFFSEQDYRKIQNIATINPISIIKLYSDEVKKRTLNAHDIAKKIDPSMNAVSIQSLLYDLVAQGFINYDADNQTVELRDKIFHYASANQKKVDYDVLRFRSESKEVNASMALTDTTISVNGVKNVELSDKQKVGVAPDEEHIVLKKNRNFDFDGKLFAGYSIFHGKDYHFDYNKFEIKVDSARFVDLYLRVGTDKYGKPIANAINSRIEHLQGILLIDAPTNKSGREDVKMFPSFQARSNSFVFYDNRGTQQGIYKRDSFFFKLDKFSLDGLDSLTKNDLKFKGLMRTGDIFPDFRETLTLQPDSSLGFVTISPKNGYPVYKNKGNFTGEMKLNNGGFFGNGSLSYLGASINSNDIIYHPKHLMASAKTFELKEDRSGSVQVPQVTGPGIQIDWKPYRDSMYLTANESAFAFFKEGKHSLRSTVILTPTGVKGIGTFEWDRARLTSKLYSFGAFSVAADTMNMGIKAIGTPDQLAFDTKNVRGKIDFDEQIGRFKANSDDIQTAMPYNKYKTSINEFAWDLKNEIINFKTDGNDATFLCSDKDQDSLRFKGRTAAYDLKSNLLKVGGVNVIQSCDAYIYPDKENVEIREGGVMATLNNAKIVCDTINRHHIINRATVNLKGKKNYQAEGYYEYNIASRNQEIKFDNIVGERIGKGQRAEKQTETRARGEVKQGDDFHIDHKTLFKGNITLAANSKNLKFEGYAKLDAENLPDKQWFAINSAADKTDLAIQYSFPKNERGDMLHTGLFISKENEVLYPRVMMPIYFRKDRALIDVTGIFKYTPKTDEFTFGDSSKIIGGILRGNKLVYNNKNASINVEGKFNMGSGLSYIKLQTAGRAKTNFLSATETVSTNDSGSIKAARINVETMATLDMMVPEKLLKVMAQDIQAGSFDSPDIDYNKDDFYEKALAEFIPDNRDLYKIINEMRTRTLDVPSKYNKTNFFFSRLNMRWDADLKSFVSQNKKVELNNVAGININKILTGYVEFKMPSNEDDKVQVYLKTGNDYFYYFAYQKGILSITSNNQKMEEEFNKMKPKERIKKMDDGEAFEIQWVEMGAAEMFVRKVNAGQK
jgi:hypothetical protein